MSRFASPPLLVPGDTVLDVVCFADVERGIGASKDIDEVHDSSDDDAIVDGASPAMIVFWPKAMSEAACGGS